MPSPDATWPDGTNRPRTIYVCDRGHTDHSTLRGVCWACFPGGRGKPNQVRVPVLPQQVAEDLAVALEEIVAIYEDDVLTNSAAQDRTEIVAHQALNTYHAAIGRNDGA